ncbi:MAG: hypothetical protein M5T52_03955 [Ignavibacteriaceae bacterium]|nr:hypothetical protein [Ignavibacteriaceae bacterium]
MYKLIVMVLLSYLLSFTITQAQINKFSKALEIKLSETPANHETLVWIYFNDKGQDVNFYLSNPEIVVSQKSLNRRAKVFDKS